MRKKTPDLETVLREALKNSGLSTYKLEEKTGVAQAVICRFLNGKRSITLPTAKKIAEAMGLELVPKKGKKRQVKP